MHWALNFKLIIILGQQNIISSLVLMSLNNQNEMFKGPTECPFFSSRWCSHENGLFSALLSLFNQNLMCQAPRKVDIFKTFTLLWLRTPRTPYSKDFSSIAAPCLPKNGKIKIQIGAHRKSEAWVTEYGLTNWVVKIISDIWIFGFRSFGIRLFGSLKSRLIDIIQCWASKNRHFWHLAFQLLIKIDSYRLCRQLPSIIWGPNIYEILKAK